MLLYNSAECLRPLVWLSSRRVGVHLLSFSSSVSLESGAGSVGKGPEEISSPGKFLWTDSSYITSHMCCMGSTYRSSRQWKGAIACYGLAGKYI